MKLSASDILAAESVAKALSVPIDWLLSLIEFETAGTFSPTVKNPLSSARGLIQFMDETARGMGYAGSADLVAKHPTFDGQLKGPVYAYLKKYMPFLTKQSLYMAVFYPKYRNVSPDTLFSAAIRNVNPGIDTVQSYVDKVDKKKRKSPKAPEPLP